MPQATTDSSTKPCIHCGTFFRAHNAEEQFCCKGCEFVYGLIQGQGLDQFYQLRRGKSDPVKGIPFQPRQWGWLPPLIAEAEQTKPNAPSLVLDLQGISCIGCVWLIDKLYARQSGTMEIEVNAQRGQLRISWVTGKFDALAFGHELQQFGYLIGPASAEQRDESQRLTSRLGLCGAFALNAMMFSLPRYLGMGKDFPLANLLELLSVLFSTLCLAVGGSYFIGRAMAALRQRTPHIDIAIALGIVVAYLISLIGWLSGIDALRYFDILAVVIFIMLLASWTRAYRSKS